MLIVRDISAFWWAYAILMSICDAVTIYCVYFIALEIRDGNKKIAFMAGLLAATAFSAAYHVLICYDAFAVMLMMLGLYWTICKGDHMKSYAGILCGYLAKLFPIVIFPFVFFYNMRKSNWSTEWKEIARPALPLLMFLVIPFILINPESVWVYFDRTEIDKGVFGATLNYALTAFLHYIGITITPVVMTTALYVVLAIMLVVLVWAAYHNKTMDPIELLKYSLLALTALIVFVPHHSPQYMIWIVPILAILAADDWWKILWFYILQVFLYIRFPLTYYSNWTNAGYNPANFGITLAFFMIQFMVLAYLIWITTKSNSLWSNYD
jgi:hypothetical protein